MKRADSQSAYACTKQKAIRTVVLELLSYSWAENSKEWEITTFLLFSWKYCWKSRGIQVGKFWKEVSVFQTLKFHYFFAILVIKPQNIWQKKVACTFLKGLPLFLCQPGSGPHCLLVHLTSYIPPFRRMDSNYCYGFGDCSGCFMIGRGSAEGK